MIWRKKMLIFKLIKLLDYIRSNWTYLPKGLQYDLVEQLEDYKEMIVISKYERSRNG